MTTAQILSLLSLVVLVPHFAEVQESILRFYIVIYLLHSRSASWNQIGSRGT